MDRFLTFKLTLLAALAIAVLWAPLTHAADLPADAAAAVAGFDKICADAQAKADAVKAEAAKRLLPLLDASMKKATQAGNLDAAMAVKGEMEEARGLLVAAVFGPATPASDGRVVGSWVVDNGPGQGKNFSFTKDGKWSSPWPGFAGSWSFDNGTLSLVSADGRPCAAELTGERSMSIKSNVSCTLKKQGR